MAQKQVISFRKLVIRFVFLYAILLGMASGIIFSSISSKKKEFAASISNSLFNFLSTRDLRTVQTIVRPVIPSVFSKILILENGSSILFETGNKSSFDRNIEISAYGFRMLYFYTILDVLVYVVFTAMLLMAIALFAFNWERKRINFAFESTLEISNARAIQMMSRQVAHDIRSPLSVLNIVLSSDPMNKNRDLIEQVVFRINGIANDLLLRSKHAESIRKESNSLIDLVRTATGALAEKKLLYPDFSFELSSEHEQIFAHADANELSRMLSNILNNSVEASKSKSNIHVQIYGNGKRSSIIITDYGAGIPEETLKIIGKNEVTSKGDIGNGLGLLHAFENMRSWGGEIKIVSKLNVGTQVILDFKAQV